MPVMINRRFTVLRRLPKPTEGGKSEEALFKFEVEVNGSWLLMKKEMTLGETKMIAVSPYIYLLEISSWDSTQTEYMDTMTQIVGSNLLTDGDFEGYEVLQDGDFSKEGSENVLNGDFSEKGTEQVLNGDFSQEGAEEVTNGDFAGDLDDWTTYGTTSATEGIATIGASTNSGIFQNTLTNGKSYTVTINVTSYDGVGIAEVANNNGVSIYTITTTGIQTFTFTHNISSGNLLIRGMSNALFSISSVSVKELGQDWSKQEGWTIGDGSANFLGIGVGNRNLYQQILTVGKTYELKYDVLNFVAGGVRNVSTASSVLRTANGSYTEGFIATSSTLYLKCEPYADLSIDNVSIKEVGQDWGFGGGWGISGGSANSTGSNANQSLYQDVGGVSGKVYKISIDVSNYVSGNIQLGGSSNFLLIDADGSFSFYRNWTSDTNLYIRSGGVPFIGSIDNVSVKEVGQDWGLGEGWSIGGGKATTDGTILEGI